MHVIGKIWYRNQIKTTLGCLETWPRGHFWEWKTVDKQKNPLQIGTQCPLHCPTFTRAPLQPKFWLGYLKKRFVFRLVLIENRPRALCLHGVWTLGERWMNSGSLFSFSVTSPKPNGNHTDEPKTMDPESTFYSKTRFLFLFCINFLWILRGGIFPFFVYKNLVS